MLVPVDPELRVLAPVEFNRTCVRLYHGPHCPCNVAHTRKELNLMQEIGDEGIIFRAALQGDFRVIGRRQISLDIEESLVFIGVLFSPLGFEVVHFTEFTEGVGKVEGARIGRRVLKINEFDIVSAPCICVEDIEALTIHVAKYRLDGEGLSQSLGLSSQNRLNSVVLTTQPGIASYSRKGRVESLALGRVCHEAV